MLLFLIPILLTVEIRVKSTGETQNTEPNKWSLPLFILYWKPHGTDAAPAFLHWNISNASTVSNVITHAGDNRALSKVINGMCDFLCVSVCPHSKSKMA